MRCSLGRWIVLEAGFALAAALCVLPAAESRGQNLIKQIQGALKVVAPAPAQKDGKAESGADEDTADNVFLPAERLTLQRLSKSRELLEEGRYGEAVRCLGAILDGPEDFFFQPDKKAPIHRSLKAEAQRLIGRMPREGRELYELQYGARARQMLEEAVAAGDVARLAEVSRRFFHTRSGYEATLLLGLHHFDHGRPLAGALTLQRLREAPGSSDDFEPVLSLATATCWLQAGMPEKAREVLVVLRARHPSMKVEVAGRNVPLFAKDSGALDWLVAMVGPQFAAAPAEADRWLMFRGDAARNAATAGSAPLLNMRWRVPSTDDPAVEDILEQLRRVYAEQGTPTLPGLHPLAVDDVVLMRTSRNLVAVDFLTGKRLWEVPVEEAADLAANGSQAEAPLRQASALAAVVGQRIWDDMTYGTISSDGRCVYTIEDLGFGIGPFNTVGFGGGVIQIGIGRNVIGGIRRAGAVQANGLYNRLAAHDIHTGKLTWHLGGPADQFALRQPETFFLGPPLPLMGQLYVLAEVKGEIRLLALEAATGNLAWSQQLAVVEQSIQQDPLRRLAGVSPSYADGVLVCPTSTGAIVGVELATRSLLWGYRYGRERNANRMGNIVMLPFPNGLNRGAQATHRWMDASVCIAEGRILATPIESESLHCLSLIDGELLWKQPRQSDLYVACVDQDKVVLVGRNAVRALRLADGKPAWDGRTVALPEQSAPSGRGFLSNDRYYLPLSSAEVACIDLKDGKTLHLSKSRKGSVPGNLVCYKGRVLSQGFDGLDAFYQLDSATADVQRRLKADPGDAEALSLRGEILLDAGKRSEAVACLQRAYALDAEPRTRELLRESLLEGLRTDFAAYRQRSRDIERLLDDPSQQAGYLRLMAGGLQQTGELAAAFDHYQKLIDLDSDHRPLDPIGKILTVRRDRWIQAQLAALRNEAKDDAAAKIDGAVDTRLKAALAAGSIDELQRFVDYFGNQPIAESARDELIRRLRTSGRLLDAELLLWRKARSADPPEIAATTASVVDLLRQSGRNDEAALGYLWLGRQFADVVCRDGKNGAQWLGSLAPDDPVRQRLDRDGAWPVGKVEVGAGTSKTNSTVNGYGRYALELRGSPGPFFSDLSIQFDQNRRMLIGSDGLGQERWQVSLAEDGQQQFFAHNRNLTHIKACGHLLVLAMGFKIIAVDTLGADAKGTPRLLWSQDLTDPGADAASLRQLPLQLANLPWQLQQIQFSHLYNRASTLGPVTSRYVCFQRFRNLTAVDPRTGETLWIRHDVPPGSELFGDDDYVFVLPPDRPEALLLRALDGELLGTRKVPRPEARQLSPNGGEQVIFSPFDESCIATLGRQLLLWRIEGGNRVLSLFDPLEGRDRWPPRKFAAGAHAAVVGGEAVGVFEPDGHFVLLGLPDGRTIADTRLEAEKSLAGIILIESGEQYFLMTHSLPSEANNNPRPMQPMPGCSVKPITRGRLYAFDRQGRVQWPEPVSIKDQHFLLNQPDRLPILTFACQIYEQRANGQGRYQVAVLCVDKRTGRTVYKGDSTDPTGMFNIVGDPEKKTVNLNLQRNMEKRNSVTLTFTDKPIPPAPAAGSEPAGAEKGGKTPRALWKSIQRAFGRIMDESGEEGNPFQQ